ncbi:hypothetical protein [Nocardia asteroides]|uniref:hypothetical protein n=1 Tax=Nocardia asteroides TaxID=1824 RepID=UPI001E3F3B31|nr:hypothetical protein [Nocardia asteroides]UGT63681.1 hypothetical protein LTT61_10360 [Nocardia asteroides]
MALHSTATTITSTVSPEQARLDEFGTWRLDWLPDIPLTRDQAVSGMVLDEVLSDSAAVHDAMAVELAQLRAAELGLDLTQVLLRLFLRIQQRDAARLCWPAEPARASSPA